MTYQCTIRDRMTGDYVYTTRQHATYQGAHQVAEAACKRKYGRDNARYEICDCE
jgi:hypothetical protein